MRVWEEQLGVQGGKKIDSTTGGEMRKHGQQQGGGEQKALPPSAYPPCLRPSGCRSSEPQVLDEFQWICEDKDSELKEHHCCLLSS